MESQYSIAAPPDPLSELLRYKTGCFWIRCLTSGGKIDFQNIKTLIFAEKLQKYELKADCFWFC